MKPDGIAVDSCVHITMPANELMYSIHNTGNNPHRMPAMLKREHHEVWLNGSTNDALAVLHQYDQVLMVAYEVSTRVNAPKNNDATMIEVAAA